MRLSLLSTNHHYHYTYAHGLPGSFARANETLHQRATSGPAQINRQSLCTYVCVLTTLHALISMPAPAAPPKCFRIFKFYAINPHRRFLPLRLLQGKRRMILTLPKMNRSRVHLAQSVCCRCNLVSWSSVPGLNHDRSVPCPAAWAMLSQSFRGACKNTRVLRKPGVVRLFVSLDL